MKLCIVLLIATVIYGLGMRHLVVELKTKTSEEERKTYQTWPMIIAATVFYLTVVIQTTRLSLMGVLPLL